MIASKICLRLCKVCYGMRTRAGFARLLRCACSARGARAADLKAIAPAERICGAQLECGSSLRPPPVNPVHIALISLTLGRHCPHLAAAGHQPHLDRSRGRSPAAGDLRHRAQVNYEEKLSAVGEDRTRKKA